MKHENDVRNVVDSVSKLWEFTFSPGYEDTESMLYFLIVSQLHVLA